MRIVTVELTIEASPETVYRHLTDADALLRWIATSADSEPTPGGRLRWTFQNGAVMRGRYLELQPPHRLVFSYGWEGDLMGVPPESTRVEIELHPRPGGTLLTLTHRLLPDDVGDVHADGWTYFLNRLADLLATSAEDRANPSR